MAEARLSGCDTGHAIRLTMNAQSSVGGKVTATILQAGIG
jgi:hypothetical protein